MIVLCFIPHAADAGNENVPIGLDKPWNDAEPREFPPEFLGWWNAMSDGPPQGIQILPNGSIVLSDKNPDNKGVIYYRVIRIIGDDIYLVGEFHNFYINDPSYEYIWLKIYNASKSDPLFSGKRMAFYTSGKVSALAFKTYTSQRLWEGFVAEGTRGWIRYFTFGRDQ